MNNNRISSFFPSLNSAIGLPQGRITAGAAFVTVPVAQEKAMVHAQLYRMAREQAIKDLAPPAHVGRFLNGN